MKRRSNVSREKKIGLFLYYNLISVYVEIKFLTQSNERTFACTKSPIKNRKLAR